MMTYLGYATDEARDYLKQFARDEEGSNTVEFMLMVPIYVWFFLATYVFFDAYRLQSLNAKVGYTIGDIVSRQDDPVTPAFIDAMHFMQQSMTNTNTPNRMRIVAYRFDEDSDDLELIWSHARGTAEITQGRLDGMRAAIPDMADQEWGILVQTSVDYNPIFAAGISYTSFTDFVVQSTRTAAVCFHPVNQPGTQDPADLVCG